MSKEDTVKCIKCKMETTRPVDSYWKYSYHAPWCKGGNLVLIQAPKVQP